MDPLISNLFSFFLNPNFSGWLFALKALFIIATFFILGMLTFTFFKTKWFKKRMFFDLIEFLTYRPYGIKKTGKQWAKTVSRLEGGLESEYKLAVIEADSLLNEVLKRIGYDGDTLGERLKKVPADIMPSIEEVWEAHKVRNNIVHDPDYRLTLDGAKKAVERYEKVLSELGMF